MMDIMEIIERFGRMTKHSNGFPEDAHIYGLIACDTCKAENSDDDRKGYGCPECDIKGDAISKLGLYEDAVESCKLVRVVRCGDCTRWKREYADRTGEHGICFFGTDKGVLANIDDYCSHGKRLEA